MTRAVDLFARPSADFDARITHAEAVLRDAASAHPRRTVLTTSLGAEDMVVTDLIARHALPIALATLDTGTLHAETLALAGRVEDHYRLRIERWQPDDVSVVRFVARHGERAMYDSVELRKTCCALRKLGPLARALAGRSAWVTGLRREQSGQRAEVPFSETDEHGRAKFNPLADWTWGDVWHYIALHRVPYNELHDRHFPSIGCEPCTRAISLGEDFRAGRWWWESESAKECGLHVKPHSADAPASVDSRSEASALASAQAHIGAADVCRSQNDAKECGLHVSQLPAEVLA